MHSYCDDANCVTLSKRTCVQPFCEMLLQVNTPKHINNKSVMLEDLPRRLPVAVGKALAFCKNNKTVCRILNYNPYVITLRKGLKLAKIAGFDTIAAMLPVNNIDADPPVTSASEPHMYVSKTELDMFHKSYGFNLSPTLSEDMRYEVLKMLYRYKAVFARDVSEIKLAKGEPLKLNLYTDCKMFKRQFRLSDEDKAEMTKQLKVMHEAGVIEPSDCPWYNAPAFMVFKKDRSKRLVVDLRGINSLIIPKTVALPHIDELIDTITASKPQFLSCLDITSAFWQLGIADESRDYTSFSGPDGRRWRFCRCPMGLCNSPAHLVMLLGNLFSDKTRYHNVLCYMDDLVLYTQDWESHLQQLELTLQTLQDANLSCNPRKTEIGFPEICYLGYRVSGESVRINKKRIEAIDKIVAPKSVKGLQRLLGMMNYWRTMVPFFAKDTHNMRKLLKKDEPFRWTPACQSELEYLKKCLVSDPILKPLDPNKDLIASIDGSVHGLGFCILQEHEDQKLHAVKYGAYATTPHQANYSADDLELTALMYALKSIENLALIRHVTVITDNSHVLHLKDWKATNARQKRMIAYIMQFNLSLVYIRGSRNLLADALSRLFQDSSAHERVEHQAKYMHTDDDFVLPVITRSTQRKFQDGKDQLLSPSDAFAERDSGESERPPSPPSRPAVSRHARLMAQHDATTPPPAASDVTSPADWPDEPAESSESQAHDSVAVNGNSKVDPQIADEDEMSRVITASDYQQDEEFMNVYKYVDEG